MPDRAAKPTCLVGIWARRILKSVKPLSHDNTGEVTVTVDAFIQ